MTNCCDSSPACWWWGEKRKMEYSSLCCHFLCAFSVLTWHRIPLHWMQRWGACAFVVRSPESNKNKQEVAFCYCYIVYIYINGVIPRTGNILSHIFTSYFPLFLSIKMKCCTSSQTQIFANTVCPPVTFLTFLAEHEMHPHDTTGAKSHLYGASRKENKEPTDQPCHSGVGKNAEIFVMISSQIFKTEGEEITLHVRYVGRGE